MKDLYIDRTHSRNAILKRMGFRSYEAYLRSQVWQDVKREVFLMVGRKCCVCEGAAEVVHHQRYTQANLSGRSTRWLHPICRYCHEQIHLDHNRKKLSLAETGKKLKRFMRREER